MQKDFKTDFKKIVQQGVQTVMDLFVKSMAESASQATGSLGVDIGSFSVKVVRLDFSKEGHKVLGYAVEKVVEKNYREALGKAFVKAKVSLDQSAVLSIAGQGVVSRYIELPLMNRQELDSSMKFEIEKYVPFALAEVSSDYAVIHEMKDKAKMVVLIAAAKNDILLKKCNVAKEINLNLKAVDLDCLALANFFTELSGIPKKGACLGVINIGKTVSNINILVEGTPYLSRDIFLGGDDITKKIAEVLEIDYIEAEHLKNDPKKRLQELTGAWDQVLHNLAAEIRVSLDYFEARNNRAVDRIYVVGGSSRLAGIEEYLHHALAIDIKKLDPCPALKFDQAINQEDFKKDFDLMAIALGLALR